PTTPTSSLSLHDALPIYGTAGAGPVEGRLRRAARRSAPAGARLGRRYVPGGRHRTPRAHRPGARGPGQRSGTLPLGVVTARVTGDRKSTRLNSSHRTISY